MKKTVAIYCALLVVSLFIVGGKILFAEETGDTSPAGSLILEQAVMCESLEAYAPKNMAVVFSIDVVKVLCFTSFNHVPREMAIYHNWYRKDQLSSKRKLVLKPPKWSSFSGIQFRETDKGPWRVDITDEEGNILQTLRFSVTD